MLRRFGLFAALGVIATMFAGTSSAQVSTTETCIFEGLAGDLDNEGSNYGDPDGEGIQNALSDIQGGGLGLDTETGRYDFSTTGGGQASCSNAVGITRPVTIDSSGYYDNIICGTGSAHDLEGDNTVISDGPAGFPDITGAGYEIPFVAGNGPLLIFPSGPEGVVANLWSPGPDVHTDIDGGTDDALDEDHSGRETNGWSGTGAVHITPGQGPATDLQTRDNCITETPGHTNKSGTDQFQVAGFAILCNPACVSTSPPPCPPGQVGTPPACVNDLGGGSGEPSDLCDQPPGTATVSVIDQKFNGENQHVRLEVKQNGTSSVWVCVRVVANGEGFGGRFIVETLGGGNPASYVDENSSACKTTAGNTAPGDHPLTEGGIGGQYTMVDSWTNATRDEVWVCFAFGGDPNANPPGPPILQKRIRIPVSSLVTSVRFERDAI